MLVISLLFKKKKLSCICASQTMSLTKLF